MQVRTMFFTNKRHKKHPQQRQPRVTPTGLCRLISSDQNEFITCGTPFHGLARFIGTGWFPKPRRSRIHKWSYTWGDGVPINGHINEFEWPNWGEISPQNKWSYGHSTKITGDGVHFVINKLKGHPPSVGDS